MKIRANNDLTIENFNDLKKASEALKAVQPDIRGEIDNTILKFGDLPLFNLTGILLNETISGGSFLTCDSISPQIAENDRIEMRIMVAEGDLVDYIKDLTMEISYYEAELDTSDWTPVQLQKLDDFVVQLKNLLKTAQNQEKIVSNFFNSFRELNLELKSLNSQFAPTIAFICNPIAENLVLKIQQNFYIETEFKFQEAQRFRVSSIDKLEIAIEDFLTDFEAFADHQQDIEIEQVAAAMNLNKNILADFVYGRNSTVDDNYECAKAIVTYDDGSFEFIKDEMMKMVEYVNFYAKTSKIYNMG